MSDSRPTEQPEHEHNIVLTAKGGGIITFGKLINYGSRFLITFLVARLLTAEDYGMYNLAISGAAIAAAFARFGLDTGTLRYVAVMNGRRDQEGLWGTLQVGVVGTVLFGSLAATLLFALAYPIAEHAFDAPRLAPFLQVASVFVPMLALGDILSAATRGFKSMRESVLSENIIQPLVRLVIIVLLALTGMDVVKAIVAFGLADVASGIMLIYFLNKRFGLRRPLQDARRPTREIVGFSLPLWLSDIMSSLRGNLQTILIGSLSTIRNVGIFTIADQVNMVGSIVHQAIVVSARPVVSELHDQGDWRQLTRLYQTTTRWVIMLNLPAILLMFLFPRQIMSLFGSEFTEGASALVILAGASLINIATGMCGAIIEMTGQSKWKLFNSALRVIFSILFNFLLIPRWGIIGAAVATVMLAIVSNVLPMLEVWYLYKLLPFNRSFIGLIIAAVSALLSAWLLNLWLPVDESLISTVIVMLVVVAVYAATVLVLGLSPADQAMLTSLRRRATALLPGLGRA